MTINNWLLIKCVGRSVVHSVKKNISNNWFEQQYFILAISLDLLRRKLRAAVKRTHLAASSVLMVLMRVKDIIHKIPKLRLLKGKMT